jgi:hypothetical protein
MSVRVLVRARRELRRAEEARLLGRADGGDAAQDHGRRGLFDAGGVARAVDVGNARLAVLVDDGHGAAALAVEHQVAPGRVGELRHG